MPDGLQESAAATSGAPRSAAQRVAPARRHAKRGPASPCCETCRSVSATHRRQPALSQVCWLADGVLTAWIVAMARHLYLRLVIRSLCLRRGRDVTTKVAEVSQKLGFSEETFGSA